MITLKLQLILLISAVACFVWSFNLIKKYKFDLRYAMLWLLMNLLVVILAAFPGLTDRLAGLIGIETPVNVLFLLGIFILYMIVFSLTVAISRLSNKVRELSQELGILREEFQAFIEQSKENSN